MAKITLSKGGFTIIPEGKTVFKITEVDYKEDFGKMEVKLQTKSGLTHTERFSLLKANGELNEKALGVFSMFAKNALNDFKIESIDHTDLVGCYIEADVRHEEFESNKEAGKMLKAVRLGNYAPAKSFGEEEVELDSPEDLDDFLND